MSGNMNKVTLYRLGCVEICDMYVEHLKAENKGGCEDCPKKAHPFEGMEEHDGKQEKELYCDNLIECAKCRDRHYEQMKDTILAKYGVQRTWRDKQ